MTHSFDRRPRPGATGTAALAAMFLCTMLWSTGMAVTPLPGALIVAQAPAPPAEAPPAAGGRGKATQPGRGYEYDPAQRRDPFNPLVRGSDTPQTPDENLPPLQRIGVTEITLIGIIWGGFGYTAMVQTPDGKGYAVRRGTRIGPNNGVVSKISENSIVVTERFTDLYGKEQEREYVKLLHLSEDEE